MIILLCYPVLCGVLLIQFGIRCWEASAHPPDGCHAEAGCPNKGYSPAVSDDQQTSSCCTFRSAAPAAHQHSECFGLRKIVCLPRSRLCPGHITIIRRHALGEGRGRPRVVQTGRAGQIKHRSLQIMQRLFIAWAHHTCKRSAQLLPARCIFQTCSGKYVGHKCVTNIKLWVSAFPAALPALSRWRLPGS